MSFATDIGRMVARGPQRPLTDRESMDLLMCSMMCEETELAQIETYKLMCQKSMGLRILDQRFRLHLGNDTPISPPALIWLSSLADRPGTVILLVAVLAHLLAEGHKITLDSLTTHYFRDGIPTELCYQTAWDAQKLTEERAKAAGIDKPDSDNMLDHQQSWK